jgi:hypothetical protein
MSFADTRATVCRTLELRLFVEVIPMHILHLHTKLDDLTAVGLPALL